MKAIGTRIKVGALVKHVDTFGEIGLVIEQWTPRGSAPFGDLCIVLWNDGVRERVYAKSLCEVVSE